jgi:hypothetical protein
MTYFRNVLLGVLGSLVVFFVIVGYMKHQNKKNFPSPEKENLSTNVDTNSPSASNTNSSADQSNDFSKVKSFLPENFPFPTDVSSVNSVKFTDMPSLGFGYQTTASVQALVDLYKNYFNEKSGWDVDSFSEGSTVGVSAMQNGNSLTPLTITINSKDGTQYVRVSYIKK